MLSRVMSHHERGSQPCQLCDAAPLPFPVTTSRHHDELTLEPGLDVSKLELRLDAFSFTDVLFTYCAFLGYLFGCDFAL